MLVRWKGWPALVSMLGFAAIKGWGEWGLLGVSALPLPAQYNRLSSRIRGRQCLSQWVVPAMNSELLSDVRGSLGFAAALSKVGTRRRSC